jgi:hypothetical protein
MEAVGTESTTERFPAAAHGIMFNLNVGPAGGASPS